jgi:hypothetical protein
MGKTGDAIMVLAVAGLVASPTLADMLDGCRAVIVNGTVCHAVEPEQLHDNHRDPGPPLGQRWQVTRANSGTAPGSSGLMPPTANMMMTGNAPEVRINYFDDTGMSPSTPLPLLAATAVASAAPAT